MSLRIVAGRLGGRTIQAPRGARTRPTPERVREAWFSALGPEVRGARVLDLFAGSGALGIEALSRGAASAHFVEADRRAVHVLEGNLTALGLGGSARVTRADVFSFLRQGGVGPFDLALADPPYRSDAARRLAGSFRSSRFAALLCLEHAPDALPAAPDVVWRRRYGDTVLTFLAAESGRAAAGASETDAVEADGPETESAERRSEEESA